MNALTRRHVAILILAVSVAFGCRPPLGQTPLGTPVLQHCQTQEAATKYFPGGLGRDVSGRDPLAAQISTQLHALGESPFSCGVVPEAAYRLTKSSFDSRLALAVRISSEGAGAELHIVQFNRAIGDGGVISKVSSLTDTQWQALNADVHRLRFWSLPPVPPATTVVFLDGSWMDRWVLEGVESGRHRALVIRPQEDLHVRDVATTMLRLAGLEMPSEWRSQH